MVSYAFRTILNTRIFLLFLLLPKSRVWAPIDRIDSVDFALNYTKQAQDFLEQELNMTFQLPKLGKSMNKIVTL